MTNIPARRFKALMETGGSTMAATDQDRAELRNLVQPLTFADFGSDIGTFRLSRAIAASAAFPIVLAPARLQTYPDRIPSHLIGRMPPVLHESETLYVADGGVYENHGIDALLSLIKGLGKRNQPVLIIVIDASQRMPTVKTDKREVWGPESVLWRLYDIGSIRPIAFYGAVASKFHNPKRLDAVMIRMSGCDERTQKKLQRIPTSFRLSKSDQKILEDAATRNVYQMSECLKASMRRLSR
jgi:hypothetical protein